MIDPTKVKAVKKALVSRRSSGVPETADIFNCPMCLSKGKESEADVADLFSAACLWELTKFAGELIEELEKRDDS